METGSSLSQSITSKSEAFDLTFSNEPASEYVLTIEIDTVYIKACWFHKSKNLVTGFAEYPLKEGKISDSIKLIIRDIPFLASEFDQCIISIATPSYTVVPSAILDSDIKEQFLITNKLNVENETVASYRLVNQKASILYAIDTELNATLNKAFMNPCIIPHVAPRLEEAFNRQKSSRQKDEVIAHIGYERVDVIALKSGKLYLCNSYYQTGKEDIAYYILYCADSLEIDQEATKLTLSGQVNRTSDTWETLATYWKSIDAASAIDHIQVSDQLHSRDNTRFDYLTQALLCAS